MKKYFWLIGISLLITSFTQAQTPNYKVVFDMTSRDSVNQQSLIRELNLIKESSPDANLEVVLYGQGLDIVVKDKSPQVAAIQKLIEDKKVSFKVCAIAMKRQNIDAGRLITGVQTVPDGIYEIISKQREGWGYIKVGH